LNPEQEKWPKRWSSFNLNLLEHLIIFFTLHRRINIAAKLHCIWTFLRRLNRIEYIQKCSEMIRNVKNCSFYMICTSINGIEHFWIVWTEVNTFKNVQKYSKILKKTLASNLLSPTTVKSLIIRTIFLTDPINDSYNVIHVSLPNMVKKYHWNLSFPYLLWGSLSGTPPVLSPPCCPHTSTIFFVRCVITSNGGFLSTIWSHMEQ